MKKSDWEKFKERENREFYLIRKDFLMDCRKKHILVYEHLLETHKDRTVVAVNDGSWLIFRTKGKNGKQIQIKNLKTDLRKILRCYACFLRAVGVDDERAMMYYFYDFITYNVSFYSGKIIFNNKTGKFEQKEGLKIDAIKTGKMMYGIVRWAIKKDISEINVNKFKDKRKRIAPENNISNTRLSKSLKQKMLRENDTKELYDRIQELYDENKSLKENVVAIGCDKKTLIKWKKQNCESKEQKINRLYNPELTMKENVKIIGYSRNTILKYLNQSNEIVENNDIIVEDNDNVIDINSERFENLKAKIQNNNSMKNIIEAFKIEKENIEEEKVDLQDDSFCWDVFGEEFMQEIEKERERKERLGIL